MVPQAHAINENMERRHEAAVGIKPRRIS